MSEEKQPEIENTIPILCVKDMKASLDYYKNALGFEWQGWGDTFTSVGRDGIGMYLCEGSQGNPGTWVWVGSHDVTRLYEEYKQSGAKIILPPTNYPHALEMHVEDLDGHVLRFGSGPLEDQPYEEMTA
ncbi:MAG: bleomycin resistance family protein [Gemmatimonadetes bacterium]|nr:bleomycin resistance family protein [Gemmatimonadota bacterium]